jgi:hypothetical protein
MDSETSKPRSTWTELSDPQLLAQCAVDTYRDSGPGGQKRNKTSSAVRIRHLPTGLIVIAEESRSQHANRVKALKRLKQAFYLKLRDTLTQEQWNADDSEKRMAIKNALDHRGRLRMGQKNAQFCPVAGIVLDVMNMQEARVSDLAKLLEISTANLVEFLQTSPKLWEQANILRERFGQKPLRGASRRFMS